MKLAVLCAAFIALISPLVAQRPDPANWRNIDGLGNNVLNPKWGTPGSQLKRMGPAAYGDGLSSVRLDSLGGPLPSARLISNIVHHAPPQGVQPTNVRALTSFLTYWGQFLDHDIGLTGGPKGIATPIENLNIPIPTGDLFFDQYSAGNKVMTISRSVYDVNTGTKNPREQLTLVTSFLDGSQVYGSDNVTFNALRLFKGGLMKTQLVNGKELPPLNTQGITNSNDAKVVNDTLLFLVGDVRGNENPALTALQTIFLREHNRRARELQNLNPTWTDEELFQEARRYVIALLQHITFDEYLPVTLGDAVTPYTGYNSSVDPSMCTEFSTAAFRYGHSEVEEFIWRVNGSGAEIAAGHLHLRDSFFNSPYTISQQGIEPILLGMAQHTQNAVDIYFVDDLRNFLFGKPGNQTSYRAGDGGLDLSAVNIERGREHGIPGINQFRSYYGLPPFKNWYDVTPDPKVFPFLQQVYNTIDDCDVYVCGLAEYHDYQNVGSTFKAVILDQYLRLRNGDRFWYENGQWNSTDFAQIQSTTLADVIVRNTDIPAQDLQCFVFAQPDGCQKPIPPPAPGPVFTTYDFYITLKKKTAAHPFYGKGHQYGFVVNGIEGGDIHVVRGQRYSFFVAISCAHSFIITNIAEANQTAPGPIVAPPVVYKPGYVGDNDAALASVVNNQGCLFFNKEMALIVEPYVPNYLFYQCDFHPLMGGNVIVAEAPAHAYAIAPLLLLVPIILAILF